MTTQNNPENQNTTPLSGSGQISKTAYPLWFVVEFPGTDQENIVQEFWTARDAYRFIERNYTDDECEADVMKRNDDGFLTTEF